MEDLATNTEDLVDLFFPIFESYITKLVEVLGKNNNKDYSDAEWHLIHESGQSGKLIKQHSLQESWEHFDLFLRRKEKFFGFIEEKQKGLVEMSFKFWTFFSPATANDYFMNQLDRPKHFNAKAIITLPFIKLLEPLFEKLDGILGDDKMSSINKMEKSLGILEIGERYLHETDFSNLESNFKKSIVRLTMGEASQLLRDIHNSSASSVILERRLKGVFKVGWRFFRTKNELESRYFKKLLSHDPNEQEKGLKLTLKKVTDFKKSFA